MSKSNSDEKRYNFQEVPKNKAVQYDELDKILLKLTGSKGVNRRNSVTGEKRNEAKQAIQALYAPKWEKGTFAKAGDVDIEEEYAPLKKQQNVNTSTEHVKPVNMSLRQAIQDLPEHLDKIMELVNKTPKSVDLTKPKVNLIDIASPNMTPEASKVVSDAIERSAEVMNKTAKPVENGELRDKIDKIFLGDISELEIDDVVELIAQEKAKWVSQMEQVIGEDEPAEFGKSHRPSDVIGLDRAKTRNDLRATQRQALAKLLDKVKA